MTWWWTSRGRDRRTGRGRRDQVCTTDGLVEWVHHHMARILSMGALVSTSPHHTLQAIRRCEEQAEVVVEEAAVVAVGACSAGGRRER